jgi:hypothetical protein
MTVIGPLRSWETVFTKSFFICSMFLSSVMSRRTTATPTGSPNGVVTRTRLAWGDASVGQGQIGDSLAPPYEQIAKRRVLDHFEQRTPGKSLRRQAEHRPHRRVGEQDEAGRILHDHRVGGAGEHRAERAALVGRRLVRERRLERGGEPRRQELSDLQILVAVADRRPPGEEERAQNLQPRRIGTTRTARSPAPASTPSRSSTPSSAISSSMRYGLPVLMERPGRPSSSENTRCTGAASSRLASECTR